MEKKAQVVVEHKFENFFGQGRDVGEFIGSEARVFVRGEQFPICVFPEGANQPSKDFVSFIMYCYSPAEVTVSLSVDILTSTGVSGHMVGNSTDRLPTSFAGGPIGWPRLISKTNLMAKNLCVNDTVTFRIILTVYGGAPCMFHGRPPLLVCCSTPPTLI